jgi:hypothetical protein
MPLTIQNAVLALIAQITGGTINNTTPDWLMRPGKIECGNRWPLVCQIYRDLTGLELPEVMPTRNWRKVDGILKCGTSGRYIVEIDESQHFNRYRGMTLRRYPAELQLAFDYNTWLDRSQAEPRQKSGRWAAPKPPLFPNAGGRHLQRAFRDALADILPPDYGFQPTIRVADFEVEHWITTESAPSQMESLLSHKIPKRYAVQPEVAAACSRALSHRD